MQPLHPGQALLGVLGARCLQRRLHFPRAGSATERALGFRAHGGGGEARGKRPDLKAEEGVGRWGGERAHAQRDEHQGGWDFRWLCAPRPLTFRILPLWGPFFGTRNRMKSKIRETGTVEPAAELSQIRADGAPKFGRI
jgi:hypothetical protein